jgi:ABC-type Fe3+ transport system substrate-binding protein
MIKRAIIVVTLIAVVALPFLLRPKSGVNSATDDRVVIITPHNEAIRYEFARGFAKWYRAKTGRTVAVDWRVIGGTGEIARFLEGEYVAGFENLWTRKMGKAWSSDVQSGFQNGRLPADAPQVVKEARAAFLQSEVSSGIDVFFGGGTYDFERQAAAGRLVDSGLLKTQPAWFTDESIPQRFGGDAYWRPDGLWIGSVLSSYGIIFNRDGLKRAGIEKEPTQWNDLADPRLIGEVGLTDPTKSSSVAKAFENIIQQQMQRRWQALQAASPQANAKELEETAVQEGWVEGLRLIQRIGANARYFTDSSQKPPIDVAAGNCTLGLCIDFYGRQQQEAVRRRGSMTRVDYAAPVGGSAAAVDPIALLRGAPNRAIGVAFMEFVLSLDGQKLWSFKPGAEGGPERFALRRSPVRRDFYSHREWKPFLSDPDDMPFEQTDPLIYREAWTGRIFREMSFVIRIMCQDTHAELREAWRAIHAAPEPAKSQALAIMQDLTAVDYQRTSDSIRARLGARDKVDEVRLARELGDMFRRNYSRAAAIAAEGSTSR